MKHLILAFAVAISFPSFAQETWFETHSDTTLLVNNSNKIVKEFAREVEKIKTGIDIDPKAIKNTTPSLIFFNAENNTVNLPFWDDVIPPQKDFFFELTGGTEEGQRAFGLLFNGYFLAHELGHALAEKLGVTFEHGFDSEYFANEIAIAYWEKAGQEDALNMCYTYVKKMLSNLENPIPENNTFRSYFIKNFYNIGTYKYAFLQFTQFIEIYENQSRHDFDELVKRHIKE